MRVAIIGGGVAGLSAARAVLQQDPDTEVTIWERSDRVGGKLRTSTFAGRQVDEAADAFLLRRPEAADMCRAVGVDDLVHPATGSASVWLDDRLRSLPGASVLGVPTNAEALAASGTVEPGAIDRLAADSGRADPPLVDDVALGPFIRERLGDAITDRLVGPLIGGINAGDVDRVSLEMLAPQLWEAAQRGGSLTDNLRRAAEGAASGTPVFAAPRGGMEVLARAVAADLSSRGVSITCNTSAAGFRSAVDLDADRVIVATDTRTAAQLIARAQPDVASALGAMESASVVVVRILAPGATLPPGSGVLVPRSARTRMTAASFASQKWADLDGTPLLRVSLGHVDDPEPIDADDDTILRWVCADLERMLGVEADPATATIHRWRDAFPQYEPGHRAVASALRRTLADSTPWLALAGTAWDGVGIPACISSGHRAGRAVIEGHTW